MILIMGNQPDKMNSKAKIELDQRELIYLLGMIDIDIRYTKNPKNKEKLKKFFNYLKGESDKLYNININIK